MFVPGLINQVGNYAAATLAKLKLPPSVFVPCPFSAPPFAVKPFAITANSVKDVVSHWPN